MQEDSQFHEAVKILDHGLVRLVDHMGSDLSIVRSARVSYDADWRAGEDEGSDRKLINYLMRNRHTTPFESVQVTFEIKAPIFVFRQWHRHRTFSYNEVSARYTALPAEYYVPEVAQITTQSTSNKQMRTDEQHSMAAAIQEVIRTQSRQAHEVYHVLIKKGCPRELARSVLPVNTYSHMFCSVSLHNLFNFLRLRLHSHAQYEIRVYAEAMLNLIEPIAPVAVGAFKASLEMDKQIERWKRFKESAAYSKALAEFEIAQDPTRNS
jgi:thymidylate synthase (FAD)